MPGMSDTFSLNGRSIGGDSPCFLIAEVAQAHDGSLGIAHSFIDAIADAGADAVKFQTHIADAESTLDEEFRIKFSREDKTRHAYWKRMEFTPEQWDGLSRHAAERGLVFLSSAFSPEAVDLLEKLQMPAWKVGSGETNNPELLARMMGTGKPILLSTGMSTVAEISDTVDLVRANQNALALFQCTSRYPAPLEQVGLNILEEFHQKFRVPVGLSDHTASIYPSLAAMAGRASLVEIHVTFNKSMFGPDTSSSLTLEELKQLAEARDAFHLMKANPVNKDEQAKSLSPMRSLFNKSVALKAPQRKGQIITRDMITTKKPGTGIHAKDLEKCIGLQLTRDMPSDVLLRWEYLRSVDQ